MQLKQHKRLICLFVFGASLILAVTGVYLWWIHTGWGGDGFGRGQGLGQGRRGPYVGEGYSLIRFMKDIHLYAGFVFIAFCGLHMACNWKAMKRHLGLEAASPPDASHSGKSFKQPIAGDE